jgi:glycosyltransferase involved in cell wall biosynthesis
MRILIANDAVIPVARYGGTERVIWYLGRELVRLGHRVTYLARAGSSCPFGEVLTWDRDRPLRELVPDDVDVVHVHHQPAKAEGLARPVVYTLHGQGSRPVVLDRNTVFVSRSQARRFGSSCFVHNGLDWDDYGKPDLSAPRGYVHFLGDAGWKVKNVRGAIRVAAAAGERLYVLGGTRLNFRMGFRLTLSPRVRFFGWVGGEEKLRLLSGSKALVFPVRWQEPFGLAIIESLYFGCPVFGTPYGALPEIVTPEFGFLSTRASELADALRASAQYDRRRCHEYAAEAFGARRMALGYLALYEKAVAGEPLNATPPRRDVAEPKLLPFE